MSHGATLTLAHSPDADDLVMWWPLTGMLAPDGAPLPGADGRPAVDCPGLRFETLAADIHTLNRRAIERHDLDVTAISAYTYPFVREHYRITRCAASFGDGYGPKLVVARDSPIMCGACVRGQRPRIAVPGDRTTAFLALSVLLGGPFEHVVMPFEAIAPAVAAGEVGAGLLIHEAQLTYAELGLRQVVDLGEWWKRETSLPLPLGLNVVRRDLDDRFGAGTLASVARALHASVAHARRHPEQCRGVLLARVGERPEWADASLVERYLGMYVNGMTEDMGDLGRTSLRRLLGDASARGLCPPPGPIDTI
ncbi:MAG TPA: MqnA/MqnD/SBP family protein [Phycisphaerales bacterium]|nr:MqnA/MqnD/SBP family protein [Phycisphaerales bacterium]